MRNKPAILNTIVILSERSESKDLRCQRSWPSPYYS